MSSMALPALDNDAAWDTLAQDLDADDSDWSASMSDQTDPYSILNISRASTAQDVRVRYRQMSLLFHPDRSASGGHGSSAVFPLVSAASTTLSAPAERAAFDVLGDLGDGKSRYDDFSETLLTRAELESHAVHGAVQSELYRRQRQSQSQLDCSAGPNPAAFEVQSQVQVDIGSGYDVLGLVVSASRSTTTRPIALLQMFWSRTLDVWTSVKVGLGVGAGRTLSLDVIGSRKLSPRTSAQMGVGGRLRLAKAVASLWLRLVHAFSQVVVGTLTLTLAPVPMLSYSVSRRPPTRGSALSAFGGVRIAGPGSGLEARIRYKLSRCYHAFAELNGALVGSSLEVGLARRFPHSAPGLTLAYSVVVSDGDGVLVQLRVERGPCRLRLPLMMEAGAAPGWKLLLVLPLLVQTGAVLARRRWRPRLSAQGELYVRQRSGALQWQRQHKADAERVAVREEDANGLVIIAARYGDLTIGADNDAGDDNDDNDDDGADDNGPGLFSGRETLFPATIDARVPLQMLVEDGRLRIAGVVSLSTMPGLFPVRHGPHCRLRVRYQFDRLDHQAVLADGEPVTLPDPAHLLPPPPPPTSSSTSPFS